MTVAAIQMRSDWFRINLSNFKMSSILFGLIIQIARKMTRWGGEGFGRKSEVAFKSLFEWCDNILSENNLHWPLNCINPSHYLLVPTVLTWESAQFPNSVSTQFFSQYTSWEPVYDFYFKLWRVTRMIFCQKSFLWGTAVVSPSYHSPLQWKPSHVWK